MRSLAMTALSTLTTLILAAHRVPMEKVSLDKVPQAVRDAAKKRFPKAEMKEASKEVVDGKTTYEITFKANRKNIDVTLTPEGTRSP